jgi:hypothetical protein
MTAGGDMHDLRLAIRALCAAPLVSVAAIVSLTLGIAANTAVFSVVNAILLKPPPYPEPDRLVLLGYNVFRSICSARVGDEAERLERPDNGVARHRGVACAQRQHE